MEICGFIGPQEILVILIGSLLFLLVPIIALIDILKNEFNGNDKLIWVLVVLLFSVIGAILYLFIGRKQKIER